VIPRIYLRKSLEALGYKSSDVVEDYQFAAVDEPAMPVRDLALAAFFDSPPSYRTAAIGVVELQNNCPAEQVLAQQRALGAPFLLAISANSIAAWAQTSHGPAKIDEAAISDCDEFFQRHAGQWSAQSVRRLKAVSLREEPSDQARLFDPSILYGIQAQVQAGLDTLLKTFLANFKASTQRSSLSIQRDYALVFPLAFRLLTAKILHDRGDPRIQQTDMHNVEEVIATVTRLYSLAPLSMRWTPAIRDQLSAAWSSLIDGLYVRNIAADDLAFVYENTLITPETRKAFGTHSTPPSVAEYVLRSLDLPTGDELQSIRVYEPFAGSCVFLTAAVRRFKELLPATWAPEEMHQHLVSHFVASEVDQFACEIARLSLILADYPNANGWHINNEDLFSGDLIASRVEQASIVVCNPPFEDFDGKPVEARSIHKPLAAIEAFLEHPPRYLGVVMPQGFLSHKKYRAAHRRLLEIYSDVELLQLPEGTFRHASIGAVVLIAQKPKAILQVADTRLRSSIVHRGASSAFASSLKPSSSESVSINPARAPSLVGLTPLQDVWEYLAAAPKLGELARIHRGMEWNIAQDSASSPQPMPGSKKGLHRIHGSLSQFRIHDTVFLDCMREHARGGAINLPWSEPKVLCSAIRTSRGPWRIAASVDEEGLLASQQFFGIWLRDAAAPRSLAEIALVLNSPVANAFSFIHDPEKGLRIEVMKRIPLPSERLGRDIIALLSEYREIGESAGPLFSDSIDDAAALLMEIDAKLLASYDLPPKLEKALLKFMNSGKRPCAHPFGPYLGTDAGGAIPLRLRLASHRKPEPRPTWLEVLSPLPEDVASVFALT
jgi:hypothetical protein